MECFNRYFDKTSYIPGLCRYCFSKVTPPRRTFCSPQCVHEYRIRKSSSYLRLCVYKRDKGICNFCKLDTKKIAKQYYTHLNKCEYKEIHSLLLQYKISDKRKIWKKKYGGGLWDADHIIPVKMGGGCCSIENIQTLCIKCHKEKTKDNRR